MLKMMEAFSKAREYWEVGLWVNASYLEANAKQGQSRSRTPQKRASAGPYQVKEILM